MNEPPQPTKQSFCDVCLMYCLLSEQVLEEMAKSMSTPILLRMLVGKPVHREVALKALTTLSKSTGQKWGLDNVQIVLLPTFKEVYESCALNIGDLTGLDKLYLPAIIQMLEEKPVLQSYAMRVLASLSAYVGVQYTLENVDVNLVTIALEQEEE